jgi:hypothetical protein
VDSNKIIPSGLSWKINHVQGHSFSVTTVTSHCLLADLQNIDL